MLFFQLSQNLNLEYSLEGLLLCSSPAKSTSFVVLEISSLQNRIAFSWHSAFSFSFCGTRINFDGVPIHGLEHFTIPLDEVR